MNVPADHAALRILLLLTLACFAVGSATAQDVPWPKPGDAPRGTVHDTDGLPIAGATVRLVADHRVNREFARAIAASLASTPLPTTRSTRDGSFALLLTNAQRQLDPGYNVDFYLIVEKQGFLPWAEPLTSGLRWYLGSRVVLRRDRNDDPLRGMPWPMGAVAAPLNISARPWIRVPKEPQLPKANARGRVAEWHKPPPTKGREIAHSLQVIDENGKPLAGVRLWFSNDCYRSTTKLPNATDADGNVTLDLPPGKYKVRCATDRHATATAEFEITAEFPTTVVQLWPATVVDLLAVTPAGAPQPFVDIGVVNQEYDRNKAPSRSVVTDSFGRVRMLLTDREGYFCYQDAPDRKAECGTEGVVKVLKNAQPMIVLRADRLPTSGEMHWFPPNGVHHGRGFQHGNCDTELVVTTLITRDIQSTWIGNTKSPSIVVRATDLPAAPKDPLLDFCLLDRRLRLRANLTIKTTDDKKVRAFRLTPSFQTGPAVGDTRGLHAFNRRAPDRSWQVWARDAEPYRLTAWAKHHASQPLALPAQTDQPANLTITFPTR